MASSRNRSAPVLRVLVVDDFAPFRKFICSTLRYMGKFQQIIEASDGVEAVQKAYEFKPNLITLDIGLPALDGITAARRIRELSIESKIIFVSVESTADVMYEAFSAGGSGYVVKGYAATELVSAVNAVLRGQRWTGQPLTIKEPVMQAPANLPSRAKE